MTELITSQHTPFIDKFFADPGKITENKAGKFFAFAASILVNALFIGIPFLICHYRIKHMKPEDLSETEAAAHKIGTEKLGGEAPEMPKEIGPEAISEQRPLNRQELPAVTFSQESSSETLNRNTKGNLLSRFVGDDEVSVLQLIKDAKAGRNLSATGSLGTLKKEARQKNFYHLCYQALYFADHDDDNVTFPGKLSQEAVGEARFRKAKEKMKAVIEGLPQEYQDVINKFVEDNKGKLAKKGKVQ